jgi:DNA polymerase-3 subunit alpha (Gram-positive type)
MSTDIIKLLQENIDCNSDIIPEEIKLQKGSVFKKEQ